MVELIRAKQRWYDYAGFAYLWAVWVFSLNIMNFIYDTYELCWEEYEKMGGKQKGQAEGMFAKKAQKAERPPHYVQAGRG